DKKNLDLEQDADYRELSFAYENNYSEIKNLPESETLAEEIAYEYLLLVAKSLLRSPAQTQSSLPSPTLEPIILEEPQPLISFPAGQLPKKNTPQGIDKFGNTILPPETPILSRQQRRNGQLEHFDGKFISPRKDKIEDILDVRLGEMVLTLDEEIKSLKNEMELARQDKDSFLELRLQELQKKINTLLLSGGAGFLVGGALDEADKETRKEARKDKLAEAQTESQIAALEAAKREREKKQEELDRGKGNEKKLEELLENIEQKLQNPDLRADHETEEYLNNQKNFYTTQLNDQKKLNKKLRDALEASEKDKYFETAKKRVENLEKSTDSDSLKEPNGSNLSSYFDEFEPFQKKLIDIRIKFGQNEENRSQKEEIKQSQEEELRSCQEKVIELNEKEISELSFEDYLTVKNLKQKVASLLIDKNKVEEPFFKLRVEELKNSLEGLENDYQNLSKEQVTDFPCEE
ncbi:32_t:CDS:2, partial [Ambispora gerdemannii]